MLEVDARIRIPLRELEFRFARSSGPGGQNVNKVNSKATLRWDVGRSSALSAELRARFLARFAARIGNDGRLSISSQRFRDQGRNVADCLGKLREMLRGVARPPRPRRPTRPSRGAGERRLAGKRLQGAAKRLRARPRADD